MARLSHQFGVSDIILENRLARFLHATLGEEGKLWRRAHKVEEATIFSIDERNAFDFTLKVFDNDPRLTILTPQTIEPSDVPLGRTISSHLAAAAGTGT